ncbi:hypothetical protein [Kribbella sp. C-35]|uniref:hypothetical protein n=1 Tax=Kribbella sp. C-35 TaxID=2789276 RepID=UPI0039781E4F
MGAPPVPATDAGLSLSAPDGDAAADIVVYCRIGERSAHSWFVLHERCRQLQRCPTLVPGSATAMAHPRQICLRADLITSQINRWIGSLFDPIHRSETITALLQADDSADQLRDQVERLRGRVAAAEAVMEKVAQGIGCRLGSGRVAGAIQRGDCREARSRDGTCRDESEMGLTRAELETYVDQLGDVAQALDSAEQEELSELYSSLRLSLTYHHTGRQSMWRSTRWVTVWRRVSEEGCVP